MGGMGGKGGGKGAPAEDDSEKADSNGKWYWQQKGEEVQIRIPLDTPATKKDITVKFKATTLSVTVRGEKVIDGAPGACPQTERSCKSCSPRWRARLRPGRACSTCS